MFISCSQEKTCGSTRNKDGVDIGKANREKCVAHLKEPGKYYCCLTRMNVAVLWSEEK